MELDRIIITGARQHNLKNVTAEIPKKKLVILTGVSGSGKSSLAFDTLYAEGQRRYIESLNAYARQFLGQMDKPLYDSIRGLAPTISIEQKAASSNPRSTVGTITEIHDYLRVLWARVGRLTCHSCGRQVSQQSAQQIVNELATLPEGKKLLVPTPQLFSFNSPQGMCPECSGLGTRMEMDPELVVPNPNLSVNEGAVKPLGAVGEGTSWGTDVVRAVARERGIDLNKPWKLLSSAHRKVILYGTGSER